MKKRGKGLVFVLAFVTSVMASARAEASDLDLLNRARSQYAKGQYQAAVATYSSVPKTSDYWVRAIEERAHTFGKMGSYDKALADVTTLQTQLFEDSTTPELYFTAALTHLKLCQYKKVYETIDRFKGKMRPRIEALEALAQQKNREFVIEVGSRTQLDSALSYAKETSQLPLLFHRDLGVRQISRSKAFERLPARLAQLAAEDLAQIRTNLGRLQLIEAEVMQRLHLIQAKKDKERPRIGTFESNGDQLQFPFDGEIWIDELDAYQVKAETCPGSGKESKL